MRFFRARTTEVAGVPVMALQLSQVGELGWELSTPVEHGLRLWDAVWAAGQRRGLVAAGRIAMWSLRIEKGYPSFAAEMTDEHHPDEAGLEFVVRPEKGDFVGRDRYLARRREGIRRSLHRLVVAEPRAAVAGGEPVLDLDGCPLGAVVSGSFGYTLRQRIAYAWLDGPSLPTGTEVAVQYLGRRVAATVRDDVYDPGGLRLRS
jgi:glycine cleavage system aminomethyltransferase T